MSTQEEIEDQRALLNIYRRNLARYLKQLASSGSTYVLPPIANGIEEERNNIRRVKRILREWGVDVIDHPDDNPSQYNESLPFDGLSDSMNRVTVSAKELVKWYTKFSNRNEAERQAMKLYYGKKVHWKGIVDGVGVYFEDIKIFLPNITAITKLKDITCTDTGIHKNSNVIIEGRIKEIQAPIESKVDAIFSKFVGGDDNVVYGWVLLEDCRVLEA